MGINQQKIQPNGGKNDTKIVKNHARKHTFDCAKCDKKFGLEKDLRNHEKTHTGEDPHNCSKCDKKFTFSWDLRKHEKTHSFKCHVCGKKFESQGNLKKHESTHTREKPFNCTQCDEKFALRGDLKKHERTHRTKKPASGQHCDKPTNQTLRVGNLNICKGLYSKEALLLNMIEHEEIDIFGVSETDILDFNEEKPFSLKGYRTYWPIKRSDNNLKRMLCFVKENVEVIKREDIMSPNISTIWLEHKPVNGHKILICLAYREFNPCTGDIEKDKTSIKEQLIRLEEFGQQVEKAAQECDNLYILGDMNIDIKRWNKKEYYLKKVAEEYQTVLGRNGLELLDFGITWERLQVNGLIKKSSLDHALSTNLPSILGHRKIKITYSDHSAILIDILAKNRKSSINRESAET